jgi:transcriptional regulator with XRE-family HTH domain
MEKTQAQVAEAMGSNQGELSRLECRGDALVSTLRRYGEAIGLRVEVVFVLDKTGHRIVLADQE